MQIEDILNIEIPLVRDGVLSSQYNADVFCLDGSVFPMTGTVKDLRSASNLLRQRNDGLDFVVNYEISFGNSAMAQGRLSKIESQNTGRNIMHFAVIPDGYKRLREGLERNGSIVVERDVSKFLNPEQIAREVIHSEIKKGNLNFDEGKITYCSVSNGNGITGYERITEEILRQISDIDKIFVPYGNGEIGLAVYNIFKERYYNREIQKMPLIIFVEIHNKKRLRGKNLTDDKTRTRYSDYESIIDDLANKTRIEIVRVSEKERDNEYGFLKEHGIRVEKTSALAFAGARKYNLNYNDRVVIINTGEGKSYEKKITHRVYESNLTRITATALLILNLLYGYIQSKDNYTERRMIKEYNSQIFLTGYSPAIADYNLEMYEAFVHGNLVNGSICTKESLQKIAEQGNEYRRKIN